MHTQTNANERKPLSVWEETASSEIARETVLVWAERFHGFSCCTQIPVLSCSMPLEPSTSFSRFLSSHNSHLHPPFELNFCYIIQSHLFPFTL